jgi:hypothetical protein
VAQPQTTAAQPVDTPGGLLQQPPRVIVDLITPCVVEAQLGQLVIAVCHESPLIAQMAEVCGLDLDANQASLCV